MARSDRLIRSMIREGNYRLRLAQRLLSRSAGARKQRADVPGTQMGSSASVHDIRDPLGLRAEGERRMREMGWGDFRKEMERFPLSERQKLMGEPIEDDA